VKSRQGRNAKVYQELVEVTTQILVKAEEKLKILRQRPDISYTTTEGLKEALTTIRTVLKTGELYKYWRKDFRVAEGLLFFCDFDDFDIGNTLCNSSLEKLASGIDKIVLVKKVDKKLPEDKKVHPKDQEATEKEVEEGGQEEVSTREHQI
jgi:hypothetical protein